MKNYDERTRYILEQRNIRLEKRHNLRGTITAVTAMTGALALVAGTTVVMSKVDGSDLLGQLTAQSSNGFDEFDKSAAYGEYIWPLDKRFNKVSTGDNGWRIKIDITDTGVDGKTDVYAVKSGIVVEVDKREHYVIIDHGDGMTALYTHFAGEDVKKGQTVKQGEVIGTAAYQASGPYFEFELFKDDVSVDVFDYISLPYGDSEYIWPLDPKFNEVSSGFDMSNFRIRISVFDTGNIGTDVYAVKSGTVAEVYEDWSRRIVIDHGNGMKSIYDNCTEVKVRRGQTVQQGEIIATTGLQASAWFEFVMLKDEIPVNPLDYIQSPIKPLLTLPDERLFVLKDDYNTPKFNFKMSDFPYKSFVLDKSVNKFYVDGAEIFSGSQISSLYVADLNDDGYREIVADVSIGGTSDHRIIAYNIKDDVLYQLADGFNYNYYTTFYNNEVGYEYRTYGTKVGVADGSGELTLDVMTKISGYTPEWEAMTHVLSGWDVNSSLFNTLIYSLDDARVTVFFLMNDEPSAVSGDKNAFADYSGVYRTEWIQTTDKDGNTIAEFTINDMPIRLTFNQQASDKLGNVIELAIGVFKQSGVHYDNYTSTVPNKNGQTATPIDVIADDGVPIKSTKGFTEEEKAEILKAYEALKVYYDKHLNINYPNASQYITSIDDVRYSTDILNRYTPDVPMPDVEFSFWVTCEDYPILSSSRKNEWYYASKINGVWTTYSEYMDANSDKASKR